MNKCAICKADLIEAELGDPALITQYKAVDHPFLCNTCIEMAIKGEDDSISWGELAELTHATQVQRFGWCMCEDPSQGQLAEDCPKREGDDE